MITAVFYDESKCVKKEPQNKVKEDFDHIMNEYKPKYIYSCDKTEHIYKKLVLSETIKWTYAIPKK